MALLNMDYWQSWPSEHCAVRPRCAGLFMNGPFRKDEIVVGRGEPWLAGQRAACGVAFFGPSTGQQLVCNFLRGILA